jgi:membrane associated rhomboid family serine protease
MQEISFSYSPVATTIFVLTILLSVFGFKRQFFLDKMLFAPYKVYHQKKWLLLITSGFVHNDFFHLLFNMITFYFFAFDLEIAIGSLNFTIIYFGSLILSHLLTLFKNKNNYTYRSLGASGAISGVIFSSILIHPTQKMIIMPIPFPLPSVIFGIAYLIWCRLATNRANDNINHEAHFSGAIAGVILMILLESQRVILIWKALFFGLLN